MEGIKKELSEDERVIEEGLFVLDQNGKGPRLIGSKCAECGDVVFPRRILCSVCDSQEPMKEVFIGERGILHTYTITRMDFLGIKAPYIMGVVKLPEADDLYAIVMIEDCAVDEAKIDMPLSLTIGEIRTDAFTGKKIIAHKYRPVR